MVLSKNRLENVATMISIEKGCFNFSDSKVDTRQFFVNASQVLIETTEIGHDELNCLIVAFYGLVYHAFGCHFVSFLNYFY